jgi:hypothetical protein
MHVAMDGQNWICKRDERDTTRYDVVIVESLNNVKEFG